MLVDLTPAVLDLKLYAGDQTAVVVTAIDRVTKLPADLSDRTWAAQSPGGHHRDAVRHLCPGQRSVTPPAGFPVPANGPRTALSSGARI